MASRWSTDPLVTVCEATGKHGSSVVNALLQNGKFRVRALTRKIDSPEAQALADKGAEIVRCNPKKRKHLERAFAKSFAVFAITDFFERDSESDPDLDKTLGVLMADVAQDVGVRQYIWSSAPNVEELSQGQVNVRHFTAKNFVERHIVANFEGFTTFVYAGIYCSSWTKHFLPQKASDGVVEFGHGFSDTAQLPIFDEEDTGRIILGIIQNAEEFDQKKVYMASEMLTLPDIVNTYTKVTGKPARYVRVSGDELAAKGEHKELRELIKWTNDYGFFYPKTKSDTLKRTKKHFPGLRTFEDWLRESGWVVNE